MDYILGLDLGASSLGWAVVEARRLKSGRLKPTRLVDAGVRIFEAGVEGEIEKGKDSSRAAQRRQARQPRRQHWRRQHRRRKLFEKLQSCGLLPPSESSTPADRKAVLDQLDAGLAEKHLTGADHLGHQKLTYLLRAQAAEKPLERYELGRALYHLAARRGFLSNRKGQDDEETAGKVLETNVPESEHEILCQPKRIKKGPRSCRWGPAVLIDAIAEIRRADKSPHYCDYRRAIVARIH